MTKDARVAYKSQSARDALEGPFTGDDGSYVDYLERHALELCAFYVLRGDLDRARLMLTRSLSDALAGNNGD